MAGLGTIINVAFIIIGGIAGVLFGGRLGCIFVKNPQFQAFATGS